MDPAAPTPPSTTLEPLPSSTVPITPNTPLVEAPSPPLLATSSPSPNPLPALTGEEWLAAQTRKVFDGVAALAASELKATSDEFQLLEQINRVASAKYAELSDTVESLEEVSKELIEQRKWEPFLVESTVLCCCVVVVLHGRACALVALKCIDTP
jgi:hypothetical protein